MARAAPFMSLIRVRARLLSVSVCHGTPPSRPSQTARIAQWSRHRTIWSRHTPTWSRPAGSPWSRPLTTATPPPSEPEDQLSGSKVRIATFNVLSSKFADPSYYPKSNKKNLEPRNRLRRVLRHVDEEIDRDSVICLQEVSAAWCSELHAHFSRAGYYMVHSQYGNKFDGFIGVAIAFPLHKFELHKCYSEKVSDLLRYKLLPFRPSSSSSSSSLMALRKAWVRLRGALSHLLSTTASFFTGKERARSGVEKGRREREGERGKGARADESREQGNVETWDVITEVQSRHNRVLCMLLQQKGTLGAYPFWVGTYHAPCQYWSPTAMVLHLSAALQYLQRQAKDTALVFCGDFNVQPDVPAYALVTQRSLIPSPSQPESSPSQSERSLLEAEGSPPAAEGSLTESKEALREGGGGMAEREGVSEESLSRVKPRYGMRSAYKEACGHEPALTNWTFTRGSTEDFKACLDYIFFSPDIKLQSVKPLANLPPGPWPTRLQPSDHVLIAADFLIPCKSRDTEALEADKDGGEEEEEGHVTQ